MESDEALRSPSGGGVIQCAQIYTRQMCACGNVYIFILPHREMDRNIKII